MYFQSLKANHKGSTEPAHPCRLCRFKNLHSLLAPYIQRMDIDKFLGLKSGFYPHFMTAHTCLKVEFKYRR